MTLPCSCPTIGTAGGESAGGAAAAGPPQDRAASTTRGDGEMARGYRASQPASSTEHADKRARVDRPAACQPALPRSSEGSARQLPRPPPRRPLGGGGGRSESDTAAAVPLPPSRRASYAGSTSQATPRCVGVRVGGRMGVGGGVDWGSLGRGPGTPPPGSGVFIAVRPACVGPWHAHPRSVGDRTGVAADLCNQLPCPEPDSALASLSNRHARAPVPCCSAGVPGAPGGEAGPDTNAAFVASDADEPASLFVGDLPEHWTRHDLFDCFAQVGRSAGRAGPGRDAQLQSLTLATAASRVGSSSHCWQWSVLGSGGGCA